jgi:hypothetical protein
MSREVKDKLCVLARQLAARVEAIQHNALLALNDVEAAQEEETARVHRDERALADIGAEASALRARVETVRAEKIARIDQVIVRVDACLESIEHAGEALSSDAEALLAAPIEHAILVFMRARAPQRAEGLCLGWIVSSHFADHVCVRVEWPSLALVAYVSFADKGTFKDARDAARWLQAAASGFEVFATKHTLADGAFTHKLRYPLPLQCNFMGCDYACWSSNALEKHKHAHQPPVTVQAHPVLADVDADVDADGVAQLGFCWSPALWRDDGKGEGKGEGYALERLRVTLFGEDIAVNVSDVPPRYLHETACRIHSLRSRDVDLVRNQTGMPRKESKEALIAERGNVVHVLC